MIIFLMAATGDSIINNTSRRMQIWNEKISTQFTSNLRMRERLWVRSLLLII